MYGTVGSSAESWYEAGIAMPFTDGANLEPLSFSHVLLSESRLVRTEAPQSRRIWSETTELLPAATASDKTHSSVRHRRITNKVWCTIVVSAS